MTSILLTVMPYLIGLGLLFVIVTLFRGIATLGAGEGVAPEVAVQRKRQSNRLMILRVAASTFGRAALFLITDQEFTGLGGFGLDANGRDPGRTLRDTHIPLDADSVLSAPLRENASRSRPVATRYKQAPVVASKIPCMRSLAAAIRSPPSARSTTRPRMRKLSLPSFTAADAVGEGGGVGAGHGVF